ncbi:MAG: hypothetical protein VW986_00375 [Gammaproteobacteria bacterium]
MNNSLYIPIRYIDRTSNSERKLFFNRSLRLLSNGRPGINYKGRIYPIAPFKKDGKLTAYFDIDLPIAELQKSTECPLIEKSAALELLQSIEPYQPTPQIEGKNKSSPTGSSVDSKESLRDIPAQVYTDPIKSEAMDPFGEKWTDTIIPAIHYYNPQIPEYGKDWFIERTQWYVYVLVNNDVINLEDENGEIFYTSSARLNAISHILEHPEYHLLPESAYFHLVPGGALKHDASSRSKYLHEPYEMLARTVFKEVMLNQDIQISEHKTFKEKWGSIDFEERDSIRPANNGITYDHWFRFDLSYSNEQLKKIFHDIFRIYDWDGPYPDGYPEIEFLKIPVIPEESLFPPNIYSTPPQIEFHEKLDDSSEWINDLEQENEQFSQQLRSLNKELSSLKEKHLTMQTDNESLEKKYKSLIAKGSRLNIEKIFTNKIFFIKRGLKTLKSYHSREKFYSILIDLLIDESLVPKKRAESTQGWLEIDKKIPTGSGDQGRLYVYKTDIDSPRFVVLIGDKRNQKEDILFLRTQDPPKDLER